MKRLPIYISLLLLLTCAKEDSQDPGTTPSNIVPKYTLTASAADGGSVSTLGGSYNKGTQVSITATASEGYRFTGWSNGSSDNPLTVTLNSNTSITANFEVIVNTYSLAVTAGEGGSVSSEGGDYSEGEQVTITATAEEGYRFIGWSDGSTQESVTITITENTEISAEFIVVYNLNISTIGEGNYSVETISGYQSGTFFDANSIISITAIPDSENSWEFHSWSGQIESNENSIEIEINENIDVVLKFMRYFNYNQPSYFFQNTPLWIDIYQIVNNNEPVFNSYGDFMNYDVSQGIADFNLDGYLDIIVAPNGSDETVRRYPVEIYLNKGDDKTFVKESDLISNNLGPTTARKTIIGDFNGDQIPDAFFTDHSIHNGWPGGIPSLILSNNQGFIFSVLDQLPNGFYHSASSGDIDNDGDLDIYVSALGNDGPNIDMESIFLINDGFGNFNMNKNIFNPSLTPITVELFDLDNDGNLDLIHGNAGEGTATKIYWGNGEDYSDERSVVIAQSDETFQEVYDIDIYDLNSDSFKDIILLRFDWRTNKSYVQIIMNYKNEIFTDKTEELIDNIEDDVHNIIWLSVFDIDDDGYIDLFETDKGHYNVNDWYSWEGVDGNIPAHWEWNGSRFVKRF